ncbi:MAG: 2'-5' RNA ligase family protein [bacterium]|nr:2'-5' RNA ligase family protein [bacterium]
MQPLKPGERFQASDWPLHITVVSPFETGDPETVRNAIGVVVESIRAFHVTAGNRALFGPNHDIPVNEIRGSAELSRLHENLIRALDRQITLKNPRYALAGYRPHVTHHHGRQAKPGETIAIQAVALVDREPDEKDAGVRRVHSVYPLRR